MRIEEYSAMFELEDRLWWFQGMRGITASILDAELMGRSNFRFLDVGCGTGYSLAWLRGRYRPTQAYGVDVSAHAAAFWKMRGVDTVAVASADALPFGRSEFDFVSCFDVIYQLDDDRAAKAVSEIHRVLKPGGVFFIREPAYEWMRGSHDIAVATRHRYTRQELKGLLSRNGFDIKRATYANTFLFGLAALHRILSRLKRSEESDVRPVAGWMNNVFTRVLGMEALALRWFALPFGLSTIVLATKGTRGIDDCKLMIDEGELMNDD